MEVDVIKKERSRQAFFVMVIISLIGSVPLLLFNVFEWTIVDAITLFLTPILEMILLFMFIVSGVIAIIYSIIAKKVRKRFGPLLIIIITLLIIRFIPFTTITLKMDFSLNKEKREEVIQMIKNEILKANVPYSASLIHLPEEYYGLSKGGNEIVFSGNSNNLQVLFYTFRGVTDNFSGFIYVSNDTAPDAIIFGSQIVEVERLAKYWYWVSAT